MIQKLSRSLIQLNAVKQCNFGLWSKVPLGPPDVVLGVSAAFKADTSPSKVDLSIGAYRDNNANPVVLPSIK